MSVSVRKVGARAYIDVLDRTISREDGAAILGHIAALVPLSLSLTFYDADQLPDNLLDGIAALKSETGQPVKIRSYTYGLTYALRRLGIAVEHVEAAAPAWPEIDIKAIGIGGSAQSLDKILKIAENLESSCVPIFIVQHVEKTYRTILHTIIKTRTTLPVLLAETGMMVESGHIYIAPADHHLTVQSGLICLTQGPPICFARPAIDTLFASLVAEYGGCVLGVVLCGYGRDGTDGAAKIKGTGGIVIAECGDDCEQARAMPDAVRGANAESNTMPIKGIASVIAAVCQRNQDQVRHSTVNAFLSAVYQRYSYDLRTYQKDSVIRRLRALIKIYGVRDFAAFQVAILTDPSHFVRFASDFPVATTVFFRHPSQLRELKEQIIPKLKTFPIIRVWSAGCSTGEEPHSLAIIFDREGLLTRAQIFATDINTRQIRVGRGRLYPKNALDQAMANYSEIYPADTLRADPGS